MLKGKTVFSSFIFFVSDSQNHGVTQVGRDWKGALQRLLLKRDQAYLVGA